MTTERLAPPPHCAGVYLNDYLEQDKGIGVQQTGALLLAFGVGTWLGTVAGGAVGQRVYNRYDLCLLYNTYFIYNGIVYYVLCVLYRFKYYSPRGRRRGSTYAMCTISSFSPRHCAAQHSEQ